MSMGNPIAHRMDRRKRFNKPPRLFKLVATVLENQVGASEAGLARSPRHTIRKFPGPHSFRPLQWTMMSVMMIPRMSSLLLRLRPPQCGMFLHAVVGGSATGSVHLLARLAIIVLQLTAAVRSRMLGRWP